MLIENFFTPDTLSPEMLDYYLSKGYYRMGQSIFTTDLIPMGMLLYPVYWLRTDVNRLDRNMLDRKLHKAKKKFTIEITEAQITEEINRVYEEYRHYVDFNAYESVHACLFADSNHNIFHTKMMLIRDGTALVAVGYFDCGNISLMGILNFYRPSHKRYSLGKLLMLLKIEYALLRGFRYYYTGYFSTRHPKFDYKFFPDKNAIDVYLSTLQKWVPYQSVTHDMLDYLLMTRLKTMHDDQTKKI